MGSELEFEALSGEQYRDKVCNALREDAKKITSQMLTLFWVMLFSAAQLIGSFIMMFVGVETLSKGSAGIALFNILASVVAILWMGKRRDDLEHMELQVRITR